MARPQSRAHDLIHRLAASPRLAPLVAVYRGAPTVKPAGRLALRELTHRDELAYYRVRENGLSVAIRHGAAAVWVLAEVFDRHCYEPSAGAGAALGEPRTILDLGANIGLFGLFSAGRWPQAQIVGFEPDLDNASLHELTTAANGLADRWELRKAAASNRNGQISFVGGKNAVSRVVEVGADEASTQVPTVDVLPLIAKADLVKMDIEGGEWEILGDPRFSREPPTVIVLEYHPYRCPTLDPRAAAEQALRSAEMKVEVTEDRGDGHGVIWAWRG